MSRLEQQGEMIDGIGVLVKCVVKTDVKSIKAGVKGQACNHDNTYTCALTYAAP